MNLIKHKNAYKRIKTKEAVFLCAKKTFKGKKVTYSHICVFVLLVLLVPVVLLYFWYFLCVQNLFVKKKNMKV